MPPINSEAIPAGIPPPLRRAIMILPSVEYALARMLRDGRKMLFVGGHRVGAGDAEGCPRRPTDRTLRSRYAREAHPPPRMVRRRPGHLEEALHLACGNSAHEPRLPAQHAASRYKRRGRDAVQSTPVGMVHASPNAVRSRFAWRQTRGWRMQSIFPAKLNC